MTARRHAALALAALLAAADVGAEPLGRLFFTPERRAALERQRQLNIQETQTLEGETLRLDGVVVRSDGKRTIWINQRPQDGAVAASGVSVAPGANATQATLTAGEETAVTLRVGEAINRATREKNDGLAGGRLIVPRRP